MNTNTATSDTVALAAAGGLQAKALGTDGMRSRVHASGLGAEMAT